MKKNAIRFLAAALLCAIPPTLGSAYAPTSATPTRGQVATTAPDPSVSAVTLSGYAIPGDPGAGCLMVRGTASGPNSMQDASGMWWQTPIGKPMDVGCFGARQDGQTDDSAAVARAIAAAQASGVGGEVRISGGLIKLGGVNVPSNIQVVGSGPNATAVFASSPNIEVFAAADPNAISNVTIRGLSFYAANGLQTGGHFVYFRNCTNCRLIDFLFSGAYIGVEVAGSNTTAVHIERGRSDGAGLYHFLVNGGSDTFLRGLVTTAGGNPQATCGVKLAVSGGTWISDSDFTGSGHGTCVQPGPGQVVSWTFVTNTALGDSGAGSGLFLNPNGGTIYSFQADNSWTSSNRLAGVASQCDNGGVVQGVTLNGHRAIVNALDGMSFACGDGIRINAPTVVGNSNPNIGGVVGRNSGIVFAPDLSHFSVHGGEFRAMFGAQPFQAYAVRVLPGASDFYTIEGVDSYGGSLSGPVFDGGTGSHKSIYNNW